MTKKKQGICVTCVYSPKCALTPVKRFSNGIQFCEEYETVHPAVANSSRGRLSKRFVQWYRSEILGLCSNCAHYPGCSFPKPEAGVWHCEDYL